jgi:hypothetical protein
MQITESENNSDLISREGNDYESREFDIQKVLFQQLEDFGVICSVYFYWKFAYKITTNICTAYIFIVSISL